jgi:hypothetical protein
MKVGKTHKISPMEEKIPIKFPPLGHESYRLEGEGVIGGGTFLTPPPSRGRLGGGWDYSRNFKYFCLGLE